MRFIERAEAHVRKIFPHIYQSRTKRGSYHFAMAFLRNKMIAVGWNQPEQVNAKAFTIARRFHLQEKITFPYVHAEEHLVGKLIGMDKLSPSLNIIVLRINKFGKLGNSIPCSNCSRVLASYGLTRIWCSNSLGEIVHYEQSDS